MIFIGCGTVANSVNSPSSASSSADNGLPPYVFSLTVRVTEDDLNFRLPIKNGTVNDLYIDWGDGVTKNYTDIPVGNAGILKTYSQEGDYTIKLSGHTYRTNVVYNLNQGGALGFGFHAEGTLGPNTFRDDINKHKLIGISGNLTALLGCYVPESNAYLFSSIFFNCINLTGGIPEGLFGSIKGIPAEYMFERTFMGCSGLTGSIPEGLFKGLSGVPARQMFHQTFRGCSGLTSIPARLFSGIRGEPAMQMFQNTFSHMSGLTSIPEGLFSGIEGAPTTSMFAATFLNCSELTSIPADLFSGISGNPASAMFNSTFRGCSKLTSIPAELFSGIEGAPASGMFNTTFQDCSGLTSIPEGLFGNLSGAPQSLMFWNTFNGCSGLAGQSATLANGQTLYQAFPVVTNTHVGGCYGGVWENFDDKEHIPVAWR